MNKISFSYEYGDEKSLSYTTSSEDLFEILEDFEYFLKGAGFHFDGNIDIVGKNE